MVMQVSTPTSGGTINSGSVAVNGNNSSSNGNASAGSFSTALNVMMSDGGGTQGSTATPGMSGISSLIQLIAPLLSAQPLSNDQMNTAMIGQIDGLVQLLEQPANSQTDSLLNNPDFQAWLQGLQSILATIVPNTSSTEASNENVMIPSAEKKKITSDQDANSMISLLFIPLLSNNQEPDLSKKEGGNQSALITQGAAVQLLKQLKEVVSGGANNTQLQQLVNELPSVLVSAAVGMNDVHKNSTASQRLSQNAFHLNAKGNEKQENVSDLVQVVPTTISKLEILAAKHNVVAKADLEQTASEDQPLFEPLKPEDASVINGQQPVIVQDLTKQDQSGHNIPKMPVLQMPAATFSDDMTKFIVKSFVLESTSDGLTEAKISLHPQHLGQVDVKLTMHNGQLVAHFMADSLAGKEMLENQLAQLRTTLQNQGIQVEKLEVSQSQGLQSGMFQDGRQQQSQQSSKDQKSSGSKTVTLDEELLEIPNEDSTHTGTAGSGSIDMMA